MTIFIGDVHGKYNQYKNILARTVNTIQVGDMGVGFRRTTGYRAGTFMQNPPHYAMLAGGHRFIRGNHDNPGVCRGHSQWIPDGAVEGDMMFVGGAASINKHLRIPDYTWWEDEELSYKQLDDMITVYTTTKPRVMVTHDCPEELAQVLLTIKSQLEPNGTRTRTAFQRMWSAHSPEIWVFGHWHHSFDHVLRGTRFVCLAELEVKEL